MDVVQARLWLTLRCVVVIAWVLSGSVQLFQEAGSDRGGVRAADAKLAKSSIESYSVGDGKAGSYVNSWISILRTHELLGDNRLKFASQLNEMGDELATLGKEVEKSRKATKELGARLEKGLQEQESLVDKVRSVPLDATSIELKMSLRRARIRFDSAAEELERLLVLKQGEVITPSSAMSKLKGPKNAAQIAKQEEEVRSRMGQSSDAYRAQVAGAQAVRQEYFNLQLPRILRSLKESVDELDLGTQYHLSRYVYLFEIFSSPMASPSRPSRSKTQFALNWQMSGQRGPRRDGPAEEGFPARPSLSPPPSSNNVGSQSFASVPPAAISQPTFGIDLGEQMARDNVEVPRILEKCAEAIELHGLDSMGIYRLSGTTSRVQRLKAALDRDLDGTDLLSEENLSDITTLPPFSSSEIDNDRLRHIRLHERVNDLPDPNYATLKFLMVTSTRSRRRNTSTR
ncbi:rho GTPase-activating protein [Rhodotorula toruloides]|uniref:Rho GTPase-activating protein n=1 Tax=Rhodotorula toruloides TaxID=5286 RepID=A0A511KTG4_RHOTO|nr:rho GTPase-activating protein [Rhodotorula toruloides]